MERLRAHNMNLHCLKCNKLGKRRMVDQGNSIYVCMGCEGMVKVD